MTNVRSVGTVVIMAEVFAPEPYTMEDVHQRLPTAIQVALGTDSLDWMLFEEESEAAEAEGLVRDPELVYYLADPIVYPSIANFEQRSKETA